VVAAADGVAEADIMDAATVDMAVRGTKSGCVGISCCLGRGALASGSRHFLLPADDRQVSRPVNSHNVSGAVIEAVILSGLQAAKDLCS